MTRVNRDVAKLQAENPGTPIPVDLVTTSASGLDPDISPAAAQFQIRRVAAERKVPESEIAQLVRDHSESRQWGFLGEPRVNVLELNLALDARYGRLH
jgi:K+-transporting ATPase ATPase C chain